MKGENAMQLPSFENYMGSSSRNYGLNSLKFYADSGTFWFSYRTLVAFKALGGPIVCRQNEWGPTTGKHLNAIEPDHSARVDGETFERLYREIFS
jgi:hypothetical protein